MVFLLRVSPSKEMGDGMKQRKKSLTSEGIERPDLIVHCSTDLTRRPDGSKSWVIMVTSNCSNVNMKNTNECCAATGSP